MGAPTSLDIGRRQDVSIESELRAALDELDELREEGVVLETAVSNLLDQPGTLARILAPIDLSHDARQRGDVFVALERHFQRTRDTLDIAIDFLAKAAVASGKSNAEADPGADAGSDLVAEERPI